MKRIQSCVPNAMTQETWLCRSALTHVAFLSLGGSPSPRLRKCTLRDRTGRLLADAQRTHTHSIWKETVKKLGTKRAHPTGVLLRRPQPPFVYDPDRTGRLLMGKPQYMLTFHEKRNVRSKPTDGIYERHPKPAKLLGSCKRLVATTGEPSPPMN